jgi:Rrf2 family nitric oxide-sensitive transcriptional repressor
MRLTRHTDYALRILLQAGQQTLSEQHGNPTARLSIAGVAHTHAISRNHAMKVVNLLSRHGYLATSRGRGGGLSLARPPSEIRLGEVVRLTEPEMQAADCAHCVLRSGCGLTPLLANAMAAFLAVLDATTLADALHQNKAAFLPKKEP